MSGEAATGEAASGTHTASPSEAVPSRAPVGIFDGGIGSFDMVRRIRAAFPLQDIIYLADRASFPYGALSEPELLASVARAATGLVRLGAGSVILASNAPSVTVLDALQPLVSVPVLGVKPPVGEALAAVGSDRVVAVAGAGVMIESEALSRHIAEESGPDQDRVIAVRADALIALVESGAFLNPSEVEAPIRAFVAELRARAPRVAAITLSSTHLPWLAEEFARLAPDLHLFDPADTVVRAFAPLATQGTGELLSIATASDRHPLSEFQAIADGLRIGITPTLVEL